MTTYKSYNLTPLDISNWFLCNIDREAGDSITHLKLQKLVYYAQAWALALNKTELFSEDFEAWAHGPVLQSLYETYKEFGAQSLPVCDCENKVTEEIAEILNEVKRVYGEKSAKTLEALTHSESPWIESRGDLPPEARCNKIIPKVTMEKYYSSLPRSIIKFLYV